MVNDDEEVLAIGLMSGTSADGVDAVVVAIREADGHPCARVVASLCRAYSSGTRERVFEAFSNATNTKELCLLNALLGEVFAEAALDVAVKSGVALGDIRFIASHGQTVWHEPEGRTVEGFQISGTLQLAEPAIIAERTGRTVIANFRSRDMAAGGEGAPLVPLVDFWLFRHPERSRAVQNIGGMGNVTWIPAGAEQGQIVAFDTGPGSALIDAAVQRLTDGRLAQDTNGSIALTGQVDTNVVADVLSHPFFVKPPPKSTGREVFGVEMVERFWNRCRRGEDLVATLTEATAASIERSYRDWIMTRGHIDDLILGGGGARNPVIVAAIQRRLGDVKIMMHEDLGVPGDFKEAIAFALLGYQTLIGRPGNVPAATGARRPVVLGQIVQG